jgi:tetratricopeptide (TPR) repeat protein
LHVTIAHAIDVALKHHEAGQLAQAESIYRQVLARDSSQTDAMHLLGVLMHQSGKTAEGIELIERALRLRRDPTYLANVGELLRCAGEVERGISCCREAIELLPNLGSAYHNLAVLLNQADRSEEAMAVARKGVELAPNDPAGRRILGSVLTSLKRFPEAVAELDRAIKLRPSDDKSWLQLAATHESAGRIEHAIFALRRVTQLLPQSPQGLQHLTRLLVHRGRYAEALSFLERLAAVAPDTTELQLSKARCLEGLNRFEPAIAICRSVLESDPKNVIAHGVIANARIQSCRLAEAEAGLREVMNSVTSANFHQIQAAAIARQGRFDDALVEIDRALALDGEYAMGHFSKGLILLFAGRLAQAWPCLEYRWKHPQMDSWRHETNKPVWDGSPLNGKRILLHAEQGLGDTIHFGRYATLVAQRGGRVIVEVQKGLEGVIRTIPGVERVVVRGQSVGEFDTLAPLLSLPGIFKTSLETIPATVPYIGGDPLKLDQWRKIIGDAPGKLKVGIAWMGGDFQRENHLRSTTLSTFAPLAAVPAVRFYSLQKGPSAKEAHHPPPGMDLVDLDPHIQDFSDTAAAIMNLDLVVSIDTSVVHVAGALAKPVWTLLHPFIGHMWMAGRDDSPWYPTMRLFRQPSPGDWESVMRKVAEELGAEVRSQKSEVRNPGRHF